MTWTPLRTSLDRRKLPVTEPTAPEGSETILLVEDDPSVRAVSEKALRRFGYHVLSAPGGEEALRVAREYEGAIDLLLTDIMMPGKNGVQVAAEVGEIRKGIRIFYMSGYADQDLIRQGLLAPDTRFLQKPFTPRELAQRIRDVIDARNRKARG